MNKDLFSFLSLEDRSKKPLDLSFDLLAIIIIQHIVIKPIAQLSNCANSPEFTPIAKVQSISRGNGKLEKLISGI